MTAADPTKKPIRGAIEVPAGAPPAKASTMRTTRITATAAAVRLTDRTRLMRGWVGRQPAAMNETSAPDAAATTKDSPHSCRNTSSAICRDRNGDSAGAAASGSPHGHGVYVCERPDGVRRSNQGSSIAVAAAPAANSPVRTPYARHARGAGAWLRRGTAVLIGSPSRRLPHASAVPTVLSMVRKGQGAETKRASDVTQGTFRPMVEWSELFALKTPPVEIFVRGSVTYLALFAMLRLLLKRESGTTGVTDLLVIVLIADAAQNAMAGQYTTVTDGVLLVAVIIGWSFVLDAIAYYFPAAARIVRPRPLLLVRDGHIIERNMRRELVTESELRSLLREQGIDNLSRVREARMEPDGQISVITHVGALSRPSRRKRRLST